MPVRIHALGRLDLELPDLRRRDRLLAQPKRAALLLYLALALPRGFHRRDRLLLLFWPESPQSAARVALRQALHFVRQQLPERTVLNRGRTEVGLDWERVWCDAAEFDGLLDERREEEALPLYRGELLPAFHLDGCPDFERWVERERSRLAHRRTRAESVLAEEAGSPANGAHIESAGPVTYEPPVRAELRGLSPISAAARSEGGILTLPSTRTRSFSPEAIQLYVRATDALAERTPQATTRAIELAEAAHRLEPSHAPTHVCLARALCMYSIYAPTSPAEILPRARAHAERALQLDPDLAEGHAHLAFATLCYDWDWRRAGAHFGHFERQVPPTVPYGRDTYALYFLVPRQRFEEALRQLEIARDAVPTSLAVAAYLSVARYFAGEYEEALREARRVLERNPDFPLGHWFAAIAHEESEAYDEAIQAARRAVSLTRRSPLMLTQLGRILARAGDREGAGAILAELGPAEGWTGSVLAFAAGIQEALGDVDGAFESLWRAYRQRLPHLVMINVAPDLKGLRKDPRFRQLLLRVGHRTGEGRRLQA